MLQPELRGIFKLIKTELDYIFNSVVVLSTFHILSSPVCLVATLLSSISTIKQRILFYSAALGPRRASKKRARPRFGFREAMNVGF